MTDTDNQFDDVQDDFDEVEELTETDAGRHSDEFQQASSAAPRPAQPNRGPHKSSTQVAAEVWAGKWGRPPAPTLLAPCTWRAPWPHAASRAASPP